MSEIQITPSPVQMQFLKADQDVVFFGGGAGGGKTWAALIDNLQWIDDPYYFSVFFRSTNTEIEKGLWIEALQLYEPFLKDSRGRFIGKAHINNKGKTITFPSGARTSFAFLELDRHADSWYGSEICREYFEEFQFRTYYQFDVLRSRNRTKSKVPCSIRCTLNPDPTHFVYDFVRPFLDTEFFPIKSLSGKTAYFLIVNDVLHTSWDREDLVSRFDKVPQTYTYIPATVEDNKHLDRSYRDRLDSLSENKRRQLLLGCWEPVENSGMYLQRDFFKKASSVPLGSTTIWAWDTAATGVEIGQSENKRADWTVGLKMSRSKEGDIYIHGMTRFQERSGPRDKMMRATVAREGYDIPLVIGVDAGPGGRFQFNEFAKACAAEGIICKADPTPNNKSKLARSELYITGCQNGHVYIVEHAFDPEDLKVFYREHELFDGERSKLVKKHDDAVDAATSGYNFLSVSRVYKTALRNQQHSKTLSSGVLQRDVPKHLESIDATTARL